MKMRRMRFWTLSGSGNKKNRPLTFRVFHVFRGSKRKKLNEILASDDPKRRKPDITLAKELLGWEPKVPLKEGLARTIEYFRG